MADDAVKTIIAKLALGGDDIDATIDAARKKLATFAGEAQTAASKDIAMAEAALASALQQVTAQQNITSAKQATAQASSSVAASTTKGTEALKEQLEAANKLYEATEKQNAALERQIERLKEASEAREKGGEKEGGGIEVGELTKKLGSTVTEASLGSGVLGGSLSALIEGAGVFGAVNTGINLAIEGVGKLIDKIKEFIEDSGGLQKVTDTFDKLTASKGVDPTEFIEKLRSATQHLVSDVDLLREANTFMQSGLKMSSEDMVKLTEATVGLARAQGNDADTAVKALTQSFLSGRAQQLGWITGIQRSQLAATGFGTTLSEVSKTNLSFEQTIKVIEERFANLGQPLLTYTDRLTQLKNVQGELFEALAQGVVTSGGFTAFMKQLGEIIERLGGMEELAKKVGDSIGNAFIFVTTVIGHIPEDFKAVKDIFGQLTDLADGLVSTLNKDFGGTQLSDSFEQMHPILNSLITLWANLSGAIKIAAVDLNTFAKIASNEEKTFSDVGSHLAQGTKQIEQAHRPSDVVAGLKNMYGHFGEAPSNAKTISEGDAQVKKIQEETQRQIQAAQDQVTENDEWNQYKGKLGNGTTTPPPPDQGLARRNALEMAKAQEQAKVAAAKDGLEQIKAIIQEETDANEEEYKKGNISIEEFYHRKDQLAQQTAVATKAAAAAEALAQEKLLEQQIQLDSKFKNSADIQKQAIESGLSRQNTAADTAANKTQSQDRMALAADLAQAQIKNINSVLDVQKSAIADATDRTKAEFDQGIIDSGTYLQQRIAQIQTLSDAERAASQQRAAQALNDHNAQAAELKTQVATAAAAIKQLDDLQNNALPQVFQKTNKQFSDAIGNNQTLQSINQAGGANITGQSTYQLQTQQSQLLQGQITNMQQLLQYATPYSDTWYTIYENILKATQEAQQLTQEMQNQYATSSQLGGLASQIGSSGKGLFTGTFGRGFVSSFSGGAQVLQGATKTQQEYATDLTTPGKGVKQDPITPVVQAAQTASQGLASSSGTGVTALNQFTSALQLAIQGLQSFISGLSGKSSTVSSGDFGGFPSSSSLGLDTSGQSALNQVMSGVKAPNVTGPGVGSGGAGQTGLFQALQQSIQGIAGDTPGSFGQLTSVLTTATKSIGNFAQVIASATSPLGGAFGGGQAGAGLGQSLGLGPLGAIGGAAGGALLGALVGQKQQQIQQDLLDAQAAARQMQEAFSAGTSSLNTTIAQMQQLITTLTTEQSNSKKGSSQFQDLINQYNQELDQLQSQATQTLQQLQQQIDVVSQPDSYQQWIQNIESVVQQYSQFAGAAQNATQLAQANEYLTSSLQNIGQQMGDQLLQDEESAIQNALQLNQLYNQRNQLELQYLNQVQSIMSQGNLTRQRTQAQSAFSQLYDAQVNYSQQLDSINQQINLAQYQLSTEQQIFNLATTKAGLESQLLTLQEQGVQEDMQRITAMQNLLATLQQTGYSITNLSSLSTNDPNALQNTLLQDLINQLNTGQGTMVTQLQELINILTEYGGLTPAGSAAVPIAGSAAVTAPNPNVLSDVFAAAYQSRAQFAYGAFRGQNF